MGTGRERSFEGTAIRLGLDGDTLLPGPPIGENIVRQKGSEEAVPSAESPQFGSAFPKDASKSMFPGMVPHREAGAARGVFRLRGRKHPQKYPQIELIANVRVR